MSRADALSSRYETGFCVFMAALAFLGRGNPDLHYPQVFYLFLLLMLLNLLAGIALRLKPDAPSISAGFILANCGTITAILAYSGGASSTLWVLYLLPIFTVCLLLEARETAWITAGVVAFNTALTLDGTEGSWNVAAFAILLKGGFFVFTALLARHLVSRDRSAHAQLQAERGKADQLTTRLESVAALSDVAMVNAGVAHDLRNAFMVILGFSDQLLQLGSLSADAQDGIERVRKVARLGGEMSDQLARHGADAKFEPSPGDLHEIACSVTALVKNAFLAQNVRLEVSPPRAPCPVRASRIHLQRLFLNLLLNALSVSKNGGLVRLTIRRDADSAVAAVEDEGPGFPPDMLPRLFVAYQTTRASAGGTGLGLNLCARIAREHGGDLAAENRPAGGAGLTLRLPLAAPE